MFGGAVAVGLDLKTVKPALATVEARCATTASRDVEQDAAAALSGARGRFGGLCRRGHIRISNATRLSSLGGRTRATTLLQLLQAYTMPVSRLHHIVLTKKL
jgi:hypothetical protein